MTDLPPDIQRDLREAMERATRVMADDLLRRARASAPRGPMPGFVPEPDADGVYRITDVSEIDPIRPETGRPATDRQPFLRHTNHPCNPRPAP